MANNATTVDAYEYYGPIVEGHTALEAGLRVDSTEEQLETIKENFLDLEGVLEEDELVDSDGNRITDLGPALVTWQDDLKVIAETEADALEHEVYA